MEKILVSGCLLGNNCKYDGSNNKVAILDEINKYFDLVPFCPEVEGGLGTPRIPSEIIASGRVINKNKVDVSAAFDEGARKALRVCSFLGITLAILKERSPSCGVHEVYNGYFNNILVKGQGITTKYLQEHGIRVINETEAEEFLKNYLEEEEKAKKIKEEKRERNEDPLTPEKHSSRPSKSFAQKSSKPYPKKNFKQNKSSFKTSKEKKAPFKKKKFDKKK